MKKRKSVVSLLVLLMLLVQMLSGFSMQAFAADEEEAPAGAPKITIVNGPVYEVEAGKENKVEISVKNLSSNLANSILVMPKLKDVDNNPLTIALDAPSNNISSISPNAGRTLTFLVDVDPLAEAKTYAVDVEFSYFNNDGVNYSSVSSIYFKVTNFSVGNTRVTMDNIKLTPSSLEVGGSGTLTAVVKNPGPLTLLGVEVALNNLDAAAISAIGVNSVKIPTFTIGDQKTVTFQIAAAESLAPGNYPVTFQVTGKDANGASITFTQQYYVSVGGSGVGEKGELEIINMKEPTQTFGVNQNFNVTFDLHNKGKAAVKNVKVSAAEYGGEAGNVVPKSSSVESFLTIEAGKTVPLTFTFAPTGNASTRNYTIEFTVEYEQNNKQVSFKQYAGVNVSNPEKTEDGETKVSKPKIIVSEYHADPRIVMAGEEFDLSMTFLNTHAAKAVKNVKMYLTMVEETSSESKTSANIFTPVDSSNTFYFDSIPSKGTVSQSIRLYTMPDAQPKTYTITVNFEYEDADGNEFTATELLGINVKQSTEVETSEIAMPTTMEMGMYNSLYFDIYNTGNVELSNVKVLLNGDIDTQNKSTFLGNCAKGESLYFEGSFAVLNEGENNVVITLSYTDPSGEEITKEMPYTITGTAPAPMDPTMDGMDPTMAEPQEGPSRTAIIIGVVVVVVLIVVLLVVKHIKKKKADAFIAHEEDDDEEDDSLQ